MPEAHLRRRVVILGASGFIGRRIVAKVLERGFQPVAVSRRASAAGFGAAIEVHDADGTDVTALRPLLSDAFGIVSCLAAPAGTLLASARMLLEMVPPDSRTRVVHLSSLAAYGSVRGVVGENTPLRGDLDEYSAAKASIDTSFAKRRNAVNLRPGIVFGPASAWWSDRIARLLVKGRLGDLRARGMGICNLVYVDDVANAVALSLEIPESACGAFNLANPDPITWNEYFLRYAHALGAPAREISSTRLAVETKCLSPALKLLEKALSTPQLARWNPWPPMRPWLTEICTRDITMDVTRAENILGMRWTPLDVALRATAEWFRAGGRTGL